MSSNEPNIHKPKPLSPEVIQRFRFNVLTACSFAMSVSIWGWLMASWQLELDFSWHGILACQAFALFGYAYYAYSKNFTVLRLSQLLFMLIVPLVAQLSLESGTVSAIILWSFLTPIAVSLIAAREERYILVWLAAYVMVVLSAYLFAPALGNSSLYATDIIVNSMLPFNLALFTCLLTLALYYSVRHRAEMDQLRKHQYFNLHEQHTQLNSANARKDLLLSTVLPERIGKRLLDKHEMIADGHSDVAVMFVDIVGFTKLTETMSPKQIVRLLDNLFSGFDEIADRYGLEKIKTIGDAYLAVGGLSNQDNGDYVEATVKTAQGFQDHIREQTKEQFHGNALDIHIGIATGPIAAGVIGKIRLTYDIWGNTVNLASRLVDHASAGQILVDQITYKRISKKFDFAQEPLLTLKGGSQVNVYRLLNSGALHHVAEGGNVVQLHA